MFEFFTAVLEERVFHSGLHILSLGGVRFRFMASIAGQASSDLFGESSRRGRASYPLERHITVHEIGCWVHAIRACAVGLRRLSPCLQVARGVQQSASQSDNTGVART